jgi:hypothetical protein
MGIGNNGTTTTFPQTVTYTSSMKFLYLFAVGCVNLGLGVGVAQWFNRQPISNSEDTATPPGKLAKACRGLSDVCRRAFSRVRPPA